LIDELAGILGLDPDPYCLRRLYRMARGRIEQDWEYAAQICATIANSVRDPKTRRQPWQMAHFHPMRPDPEPIPLGVPINRDTMPAIAFAFTGKRFEDMPDPVDLERIEFKQ